MSRVAAFRKVRTKAEVLDSVGEGEGEEGTTTKDPKTTGDSRGTEAFTKETEAFQGRKGEG